MRTVGKRIRPCATDESVLPGVQQHPHLSRRRPGQQTRKHPAAAHTRVMLFSGGVLHGTGAVQRECVVRLDRCRLPVEIRTRSTRLYPEFHFLGQRGLSPKPGIRQRPRQASLRAARPECRSEAGPVISATDAGPAISSGPFPKLTSDGHRSAHGLHQHAVRQGQILEHREMRAVGHVNGAHTLTGRLGTRRRIHPSGGPAQAQRCETSAISKSCQSSYK